MEILYTPLDFENLTECLVGVRLPYQGESLENIVQSFAPLSTWTDQFYSFENVLEGIEGTGTCSIGELNNQSTESNTYSDLFEPIELVSIES